MTVTSFGFLLLLGLGVIIYYSVTKKAQWIVLLCLSMLFYYFAATPYTIIFLVLSCLIAYASTLIIDSFVDDYSKKKLVSSIAIIAIILNVLIWFLLKGSSFWIHISSIMNKLCPSIPVLLALPIVGALGMGYYTAQVIGYILDVLWGNAKVQKNPLKLFLFISFFPQLTVGPISRYSELSTIYDGHTFLYKNICFGCQRIVWGLYKKLVISDRVGIIVNGIWADTATYNGIWPWIAVILYPAQIYTDFSGCMDIVLGAAELFDIHLAENFRNPFFSRNSQEFWQRWHITLGSWARDYVFYPLLKSKCMVAIGRKCKKKYGKHWGKFIPWSIAMAVLWFVMGFWHGSTQHIFGVSLWFWSMLFLSELLLPLGERIVGVLRIRVESFSWHLFQSIRTFFVYAFGAVFFSAPGLMGALSHYKTLIYAYRDFNPWTLYDDTILNLGITYTDINIVIVGMVALLIVGILREKYEYARNWIAMQSFGFRWIIWIVLFFTVVIYGLYGPGYDASAFIYQGF